MKWMSLVRIPSCVDMSKKKKKQCTLVLVFDMCMGQYIVRGKIGLSCVKVNPRHI
jgi:hypothetical protein